ncbi:hypothetical protein LSAT2_007710 [Lamellibrachia satsuma]|nr:hypothetical protein LSAT2_007710 [Lamellibrachia satsuma]
MTYQKLPWQSALLKSKQVIARDATLIQVEEIKWKEFGQIKPICELSERAQLRLRKVWHLELCTKRDIRVNGEEVPTQISHTSLDVSAKRVRLEKTGTADGAANMFARKHHEARDSRTKLRDRQTYLCKLHENSEFVFTTLASLKMLKSADTAEILNRTSKDSMYDDCSGQGARVLPFVNNPRIPHVLESGPTSFTNDLSLAHVIESYIVHQCAQSGARASSLCSCLATSTY